MAGVPTMKAKLERGAGFRGVLDYALGKDGGNACEIVGGNMSGHDARELAAEFALSREARPGVKKPVFHVSLALPPGEHVTSDKWAEIAGDFAREMGLEGHQMVAIRHHDTEIDHIHIITSRIGLDGSVWHGKFDVRRAIEATQCLEERHGLTRTRGLDDGLAPVSRPTKGEIEMQDRTGEPAPRLALQAIIDAALEGEPRSIFAFIKQVEEAGVTALPNVAKTGKVSGFSFEFGGVSFKASQLGKSYGWKSLQERGIEYEPDRDGAELRARADEIKRLIAESDGAGAARPGDEARPAGAGSEHDHAAVRRLPGGDRADAALRDGARRDGADEGAGFDPFEREGGQLVAGAGEPLPAVGADAGGAGGGLDLDAAADRIADLAAPADPDPVVDEPSRPLTKAQAAKAAAWEAQSAALGAPEYRLSFKGRRPELANAINLGKGKGADGSELFYSRDDVRRLIPYLSRQNLLGYDIYVTPIDKSQHFLLIDDTTPEAVEEMKAAGFAPALVQQSSEGNVQAVLRLPRRNEAQEQKAANALMVQMNRRWGDPKISGVVHPFRLAGFSNKKPGKGDVFTRIIDAAGVVCERATALLEGAREKLRAALSKPSRAEPQPRQAREIEVKPEPSDNAAARFDTLRRREIGLAESRNWTLNDSALDFRAAKAMGEEGWSVDEIAGAILARSPNLVDRHKNAVGYASKTAQNAVGEGPEGDLQDRPEGP